VYKKPSDKWSQRQREEKLEVKRYVGLRETMERAARLAKERIDESTAEEVKLQSGTAIAAQQVYYDEDRAKLRHIDPNTGDYYEDVRRSGLTTLYGSKRVVEKVMVSSGGGIYEKWEPEPASDVAMFKKHLAEKKSVAKEVVHKDGHFPTKWMEEAIDRVEASDKLVTITVERGGVAVVAQEGGEKYASHVITWQVMEHANTNPLVLAIEDVERKLDLLQKIKARVA